MNFFDSLFVNEINFAKSEHDKLNQKRWDGSNYFDNHVYIVAKRMYNDYYSEDFVISALFHDLVEDTNVTIDTIKQMGYNNSILKAVKSLTHRKDEEYDEYIKRLSNDRIAIHVKIYDIKHNLESFKDKDKNKNINKQRLYKMALAYLEMVI